MSFLITEITNWSDKRDSAYRIAPADIRKSGFRRILLNPNRIYDLIEDTDDATKSQFKFYDNHKDRRESWSYVKCNSSVAEINAANDTAFFSNMITLNIHRKKDPNKATVATTIPVECIAYADDYNPLEDTHCWICYYLGAFKRREVLADLTIDQLEDVAETGSTSTTSTTTTQR